MEVLNLGKLESGVVFFGLSAVYLQVNFYGCGLFIGLYTVWNGCV